ncbi:hypothetical protein NL676_009604 [Syzygium grande]|nr:hypothetical protein NL676_009604 [Syzygium grande]
MASPGQMASVNPIIFSCPSFIHTYFTKAYSGDTETLTKALQKSISSAAATTSSNNFESAPSTPAVATGAPLGSDQEARH